MGFHIYKSAWTTFVGNELDAVMIPSNVMDKYAVAVFPKGKTNYWGIFPFESLANLQRIYFIYFKAYKENS